MYLGNAIKSALDDAFEQNGEKTQFDQDIYYLAEDINDYLGGSRDKLKRLYTILEAVTLVANSEEQEEIDAAARKYSKGEIFDCISKVAFLAGAVWANEKKGGDYKPKEYDYCPLCGRNYE